MRDIHSFEQAVHLALELHAGQVRKGTRIPYASHLLAVASLVSEAGGSEHEVVAALLHDAVEDQGGAATLARIRELCGDEPARIVAACSDTDELPKPPWKARKQAALERLEGADRSVLLVTAADKLHNARSLLMDLREQGASVWERFNGGRDGTLWYFGRMADVLGRRLPSALARELALVVDALESLADGPGPGGP